MITIGNIIAIVFVKMDLKWNFFITNLVYNSNFAGYAHEIRISVQCSVFSVQKQALCACQKRCREKCFTKN